ncbi:MAG: hypothetical protein J6Q65_00960, partial [Lentisphaeria bacterium]|nr:hypothetical protein [Lentisphaeria bacterium]
AAESRKKRNKTNWKPIIGLILLAALVTLVIFMLTAPENAPTYTKNDKIAYKDTVENIEDGYSAVLTMDQLNAFFNESYLDKNASGAIFPLKAVFFSTDGIDLTATIYTKILTLDAVLTVVGSLEKGDDENPLVFHLKSFDFGRIPVPFAQEQILSKFAKVFYHERLQRAFRKAREVKLEEGKIIFASDKIKRVTRSRKKTK